MKTLSLHAAFLLSVTLSLALTAFADIKVTAAKGGVYVRHNVQEDWTPVAVGDVLKPEDSMKLDKKASATILIDGKDKLVVPEFVIVDLSDFRALSQEDLLLRLAMERVRSLPAEPSKDELQIPRTTTVHGENKGQVSAPPVSTTETGTLQLNGTKVLFDKGFFGTCALKTKEVFRLHPELLSNVDARIMVAGALEHMKLNGEALGEYLNIPTSGLSSQQASLLKEKVAQLRKSKR
ncbi:MAG TPA: hypothetical protein VL633_02355 [Bacteroidota bacterium]|jgi:hypothetical protein|nr:hypothetical protein [Bacteroidota bacterium]